MSNKSFFVLLGAVLSPLAIIWLTEKVNVWTGLLFFILTIFTVSAHFRRAKDF